ncbi:phosphotransferase family protein [Penicillium cosmopolitanum]|uniref:Altered inheritance of mitochondria protein 9, mitochondrial n=1 Tax=Penicillium cosmopolitanum TaxID=1131564 RepID=A0A9W9W058_9EURO|nr:phosphotransferase family protein [Penicillium cosmopolitanum]KAJ5392521.1 phosphotransferase family protein [Penicillium cosmopolitanum]
MDIKITSKELFRYTEGRWLVGDDLNQELRYVKFDVHELCRRAAEDVGDGTKVIRVDKIPSLNSRVFLLTMDDEKEIIAKVKCPITGPVMMTTISEATTLAFLDGMTSIRVPEVYCLECDEEKLGAEYILMEKMKGGPLDAKMGLYEQPGSNEDD